MNEKKYSKIFPFLPEDFDEFEEYVNFGVGFFYEKIIELINRRNLDIEIKEFENILKDIIKDKDIIEFSYAIQIFKEKGVIIEFLKGARLYVISKFEKNIIINDFLNNKPNIFKEKLVSYALKVFFGRFFRIYKVCPECGDIEKNMIYNPINRRWYCESCFSSRDPTTDLDYYYDIWDE